jgi:hypothetical protein
MNRRLVFFVLLAFVLSGCGGQNTGAPPLSPDNASAAKSPRKRFDSGFSLTLTPNFASGFGPVAYLMPEGKLPSPAPGSTATLDGGNIDFGTISPGVDYYYRYGAELTITSTSSFIVGAEISGNIAPGIPANLLTWVTSTTAASPPSSVPSMPFGTSSAPEVVYSGAAGTVTLKYDFYLMTPINAQTGASTAELTYTVMP